MTDHLRDSEDSEGMSTATWAGIAAAVMVVGGVAMYAFSNAEETTQVALPCQMIAVGNNGVYRLDGKRCSVSENYAEAINQFREKNPAVANRLRPMRNYTFVTD